MKAFKTWMWVVALVLAVPGLAAAQVTTTGTIEVIVTDQQGAAVPGATVTAESVATVTKRSGVTDAEGKATLVALEPSNQYLVVTVLTGFNTHRFENVLVRSGQTVTLRVQLQVSGVTEQVQVTAESPIVDTKSATRGQDITLQLTESLPTGRSYQSYLQLVPGVMPDDPVQSGNPASKSGLNYSDIGGSIGVSTDNFYYIDGIGVTDPLTGTFGANLNTEIIQEQKVITGAIPAEFVGTPGLLSNVVTKSGSNTFHGSGNYFFQNSDLVADNKNSASEEFSTFDAAFTIGGPVVRDRAWFFGSYRRLEREDNVTALDTLALLRTVQNEQNQGYAKGTWAPTRSDTVSFTFLNDPTNISGQRARNITNARNRVIEQGGGRWNLHYQRLMGGALVEAAYNNHDGEVSQFSAIRESANDVLFLRTDVRTLADEQLGGFGSDSVSERDSKLARGAVEWNLRGHSVKGGVEWSRNVNFRNLTTIQQASYFSLAPHLSGISAAGVAAASLSGSLRFDPTNPSDFAGFLRTVNGLPNRAAFYNAFDTNGDGTITPAELGARLFYTGTAGNPNGRVNYDRTFQSQDGPQETRSDGLSFFVQDAFTWNRLTVNVGVRAEQWKHFATTGENIFSFDWEFAPRLSAAYDVRGDGHHKAFAYWGRYYDPIRLNMTNFAGTLTGAIREEQVFANGQWVTYRVRGGPVVQDAFFAPTTQTPFTDDFNLGYEVDLGHNMSVEATYTNRRTRDILEDYDLELYATAQDGQIHYPGPLNHPQSLFLGLEYFGYTQNPGSNFVIATLAGGERNYQGVELVFRKRFADNWQGLLAYNYNDAEGNTNSDSNADFQGDVDFLDPRAPNQFGKQPGNIPHLFKANASYVWAMGLEVGAGLRYSSGTLASRTFLASRRNLPIRVTAAEAFEFAGYRTRWIAPNTVGALQNPGWAQFDVRLKYQKRFADVGTELFVDVFNLFNNQDPIRDQDLVAGTGTIRFGDPIQWLDPRRFFLGARLSF